MSVVFGTFNWTVPLYQVLFPVQVCNVDSCQRVFARLTIEACTTYWKFSGWSSQW